MKRVAVPYCCSAQMIIDFGESDTSEGGAFSVSEKKTLDDLQKMIKNATDCGLAMLMATTNNEQKTANKALRQCGFKHSRWMSKEIHPETVVRLWWKPLGI